MKYDTKFVYEVMTWNDAENPQEPREVDNYTRKADAMKAARQQAKKYALVEVIVNEVDINDEHNLWGGELVASWTNGKKTC